MASPRRCWTRRIYGPASAIGRPALGMITMPARNERDDEGLAAQAPRQLWRRPNLGECLCNEVDEDAHLGCEPTACGPHGTDRQRRRLVLAQDAESRTGAQILREQPIVRLSDPETGEDRGADLLPVVRHELALRQIRDRPVAPHQRPCARARMR